MSTLDKPELTLSDNEQAPSTDAEQPEPNARSPDSTAETEHEQPYPSPPLPSIEDEPDMRYVEITKGATGTAQTGEEQHIFELDLAVYKFERNAHNLAVRSNKHKLMPYRAAITLIEQQTFDRVREFQRENVEPRVGLFSDEDNLEVEERSRYEDRLYLIMYKGLYRQEVERQGLRRMLGYTLDDLDGSCVVEARKWLKEVVWDWAREVYNECWTMEIDEPGLWGPFALMVEAETMELEGSG